MSTQSLDYQSPRTGRRRVSWSAVAVVATVVVLLSLFVPTFAVRSTSVRMDAVTGSVQRQTTWLGCFRCGPRIETAPLETRLKQSNIAWTPTWQFLHNYEYNLVGGRGGVGCGRAPEIYSFAFSFSDEFAKSASDAELRDFVTVMQTGTEREQRETIEAVVERLCRVP
jgi:hypothetical protein